MDVNSGFEFTQNLNQMITSTTLSAELNNQFNTNIFNFKFRINYSIQILQK